MSENNLLLLRDKPQRPQREHNCKVAGDVRAGLMRQRSHRLGSQYGGYDSSTVQDVMLGAVEKRFGNQLPSTSIQWLTDNGSAYVAHETRSFAKELNLEPCTTAVSSP